MKKYIYLVIFAVIWTAGCSSSKPASKVSAQHKKDAGSYVWKESLIINTVAAEDRDTVGPDVWDPCIAIGPSDELYVAHRHKELEILRSTDGGRHWVTLKNGMKGCWIWALVVDREGTVYAGTGRGVYRSADKGENWKLVSKGLPNESVFALAVDSKNRVYAGTTDGYVLRTSNGGQHWEIIRKGSNESRDVYSICITGKGKIFFGTECDGIFRSDDDGVHWKCLNDRMVEESDDPRSSYTRVTTLVECPGDRILAASMDVLAYSDDNGSHWSKSFIEHGVSMEPKGPPKEHMACKSVAIMPTGGVVAGATSGVFETPDKGATWKSLNLLAKVPGRPNMKYEPTINGVVADSKGRKINRFYSSSPLDCNLSAWSSLIRWSIRS